MRLFWNIFKYLLAFGLLGWVIYSNWEPASGNGLKQVWERHVEQGVPINYGFLALAVAIYTVALSLTLVRWYVLVKAQDLPITLAGAFRFGLVGLFFNTFLPGSVGGDIIKAAAIAREQDRRTAAVTTVIMDRVIGLWGLIWFVAMAGSLFWLCGWIENDKAKTIVTIMLILVGVTTLIWVCLGLLGSKRADAFSEWLRGMPKVGNQFGELWITAWTYRCRQKWVLLAMALAWLGHIGFITGFFCAAHVLWDGSASNPLPTFLQHFILVPMGMIINAMPLFPGGAGIGELGFAELYKMFGSLAANGVMGSLVQRMIYWATGFVGYLVYLRMKASTKQQLEEIGEAIEEGPPDENPSEAEPESRTPASAPPRGDQVSIEPESAT